MLKNFKPISLILLAGATCFPASIFAETMPSKQGMNISQQNGKVTGTVVDDLGPVAGASVVVKGTTNGNITDMDGNFTLEGVKNGDIIQISFIGYTTQEIKYTGQSTLQIKLGLSGNFWLVSFKISYLCLPLFHETRTTPSCHPSGCAYRQL